jgi:cyclophilin family peptidyl-prolyl cis-trans isomerase
MSKAPKGRRVPPKNRGARLAAARPGDELAAIDRLDENDAPNASDTPAEAAARRTRAQNRAAKRAASGVRPKAVRGGRVEARSSRQTSTGLILLAVVAVAIGAAVLAFGNPFGSPAPSPSPSTAPAVYGDGTCPTSQPPALPAGQSKLVTIKTDKGDIVIQVDSFLSPIAAGNFVALAECKFYDGVVFHRTAALESGKPFVIQGGDPLGTGGGGPGYTIKDEPVATTYKRGTVAMARSAAPNSQGSQFFIVLSDESGPILQSANTYAIFGNVVSGMDVADAIYAASNGAELPANPVVMNSVTVSDVPAGSPGPGGSAGASGAPSMAPASAPSLGPSATP